MAHVFMGQMPFQLPNLTIKLQQVYVAKFSAFTSFTVVNSHTVKKKQTNERVDAKQC